MSLEWNYMVKFKKLSSQSGQIGLVVMLIGAVLMTIAIGAVSQSIIETKTAKQEEESSQAFNYAEQGVEQALENGLDTPASNKPIVMPPGVGYSGTYSTSENYTYKATILQGHSANVILPKALEPITITWGGTTAKVIVSILGKVDPQYTVVRNVYIAPGDTSATVTVNPTDEIMRIKVLYADSLVTVTGNLPVQSHDITAHATNNTSNETRAVLATKTKPAVPGIFDYALFSGVDISQ